MHDTTAALSVAWDNMDEASALRTLNTFAVDLIGIPNVDELFWYVAQKVVGQLNFADCVIYQANEEQSELRQVAAWGDKNPYGRNIINPLVIPFGKGITGQVAKTRKPIVVSDLLKDQHYIPDTKPARSEICVPLITRGRVVGVIDSEHPEPGAFGLPDLEILSTVAAMTAAKLELLDEAQRSAQRYEDLTASHNQLTREIDNRKALEVRLFEARRLEAIGRLTGRMAHEFNNILTVISGNLDLLATSIEDGEEVEYLDDARASAKRGAKLMQDMLVFAQKARLVPALTDINAIIERYCTATEKTMPTDLSVELVDHVWPIRIDPSAAKTILHNLVTNALDATAPNGRVTIRTENVTWMRPDDHHLDFDVPPGQYVLMSVIDTGHGIPADRLSQIFDPFFSTKSVGSGTGLGLSIVKGLAQQSGGTVNVSSQVEQGSTFAVLLPAARTPKNGLLT